MASFRKKNVTKRIAMETIPTDKSKVKFTISFTGEWDFNKDLADPESAFSGFLQNNSFSTLEQTFLDYISSQVFNHLGLFDSAKVAEFIVSNEAKASFFKAKEAISNRDKQIKLDTIKEIEQNLVKLRAEVK